jgi:hypothetical protein
VLGAWHFFASPSHTSPVAQTPSVPPMHAWPDVPGARHIGCASVVSHQALEAQTPLKQGCPAVGV